MKKSSFSRLFLCLSMAFLISACGTYTPMTSTTAPATQTDYAASHQKSDSQQQNEDQIEILFMLDQPQNLDQEDLAQFKVRFVHLPKELKGLAEDVTITAYGRYFSSYGAVIGQVILHEYHFKGQSQTITKAPFQNNLKLEKAQLQANQPYPAVGSLQNLISTLLALKFPAQTL